VDTTDYIRRKNIGGLAALLASFGVAIAVIYYAIFPPPPLPLSYADGTYRNKECGTIKLHKGLVVIGSTSVPYILERQKDGISALSPHLIGVEQDAAKCRVVYDPSQYAIYLSLGRDNPPKSVQLFDVGQNAAYVFVRDPGHSKATQPSAKP
jgi:hypothetical protein